MTSHTERPFYHYIHSHRLAVEVWTMMKNNLLGEKNWDDSYICKSFRKYVSYGFPIIFFVIPEYIMKRPVLSVIPKRAEKLFLPQQFREKVIITKHCNRRRRGAICVCIAALVDSSRNVKAHCDERVRKWRGNWRMEWVASTLDTNSEHGVSNITTADAQNSATSSWLNWRNPMI